MVPPRKTQQGSNIFTQRLVPLALLLVLAGCAGGPQVAVEPVSSQHFAPSSLVQTLTAPPAKPYVTIAHLSIVGAPGEDRVQLMAAVIKKAASLGANAILITRENAETQNSGPVIFNPAGGNYVTAAPQSILHIHADALRLGKSEAKAK